MWLLPRSFSLLCTCQCGGDAPRWGDFLPPESHQRPPKAGPSPALWNPPRGTGWRVHLPLSALGPVGSHRCPGSSTEGIYFCGSLCGYLQGLTLVRRCSQRWAAWLPAAGTPLLQGRPGHRNHPAIGQLPREAWCGGSIRGHSKGHGPTIALTHGQPRTPGRSLGGNALSGFW